MQAHIIFLFIVLGIACVTDLHQQKIPNLLTYPAMAMALTFHAMHGGWDGLLFGFAGWGAGLGLMLLPHFMGVMGAGDVKLMAVVGAVMGPSGALSAFLLTSLAGGVYALIMLAINWRLAGRVIVGLLQSVSLMPATGGMHYQPQAKLPRLCYGLAIAVGTVAACLLQPGLV